MSAPPINLRGVYMARLKRHAAISSVFSVAALVAVLSWRQKRKNQFRDFYADFDNDKLEAGMIKDGVFQSILPDGTVTAEPWK